MEIIKGSGSLPNPLVYLVPRAGLEPALPSERDFKSLASTDFATWAEKSGVYLLYLPRRLAAYHRPRGFGRGVIAFWRLEPPPKLMELLVGDRNGYVFCSYC